MRRSYCQFFVFKGGVSAQMIVPAFGIGLLFCQEQFLQDADNQEGFHRETVNAVAVVHAEVRAPFCNSVHGSHERFTSSWLQARKAERQIGGILEACSSVRVLLETFWQMFDFVFS